MSDSTPSNNELQRDDYSSESEGSVLRQTITAKSEHATVLDHNRTHVSLYPEPTIERPELARLASTFTEAIELPKNTTFAEVQQNDPRLNPTDPSFDFRLWTRSIMFAMEQKGIKRPRVDVTFQNLSVTGTGSDLKLHKTVGSAIMTPFGFAAISKHRHQQCKTILHNFNGTIKSGEMLLVLGRPGSGCTTFLKSISGHLEGAEIANGSKIQYNGVPQDVYIKNLRGEVLYNQENEAHFPHLTVAQTLQFAAEARAPSHNIKDLSRKQYCQYVTEIALSLYGLSHARDTRVGDDYLRGVSGGERKRVSIAEMAVTGALVGAWDNSTRGLDAATALQYVRSLKTSAEIMGLTHAIAIYQASQSTYDLFDKVTVLHEGRQIFFGPAETASQYFETMGWERPARMTTGDFLTSLTNPTERRARKGYESRVPRTPEDFERYWQHSLDYTQCLEQLACARKNDAEGDTALAAFRSFHEGVQSKFTRPESPYRLSVPMQVRLCVRRAYQRIWNDKASTISKFATQIIQGLIVGSIFYNTPNTTDAFFAKGSVLFCVVLVNTLMSVAEIPSLFNQRKIVEKHAHYALYHPSSEAFAGVVADFPIKILTSTLFGVIIYFLAGLKTEAGAFFTFYLFSTVTVLTMSAAFRAVAAAAKAITQAMAIAGLSILIIVIYTGFAISRPLMKPWLKWISYVNPIAYVFEALLCNEVHDVEYPCAPEYLVPPYGQGESIRCAMPGSKPGQRTVLGDDWVDSAYGYTYDHLWRNFGILLAFMIFFYTLYVILSERNYKTVSRGEYLVFRRGHEPKSALNSASDTEATASINEKNTSLDRADDAMKVLQPQKDVFTWRNVCYDVPVKGGQRRLLDHVSGWVKPCTLTALMGTSGAGKTTLLDTLAKRTTVGVITGDMLVNGKPLDASFQRKTGYVQQQDVHLETTTVREALQFSAFLRQPKSVPREEKFAYVESVIDMLGMQDFAEAIVGVPGEGLNIEQRKLLTIGVELAAKPALLLFLDEPTSGLDSQSSWSIITLLRKLADSGQAILATIHQPSAVLFQQFDRLLFLYKGGKTLYFGDLGHNSRTLLDYFENAGARQCNDDENPAEYMLEVIGAGPGKEAAANWPAIWSASTEAKEVQDELDRLGTQVAHKPISDASITAQYAMPLSSQMGCVFKRIHQQYWRTPQYVFGKLGLCTVCALFVGFSFWQPDSSQAGLQNTIFAIFMVLTIFTPLVQQIMPRFVAQRALYEVRERPSKTYSWVPFMLSNILVEIPYQVVAAILVYIAWYFSVFGTDNSLNASWTMLAFTLVFYAYTASFAFMIIAPLPDAPTAGPIAALLFSLMLTFSGVLQKPSALPSFWKFMWRVSPFTYMVGGWAAAGINGNPINCADNELAFFNPPSNATCATYLQPYFEGGALGKLLNPTATAGCQYCPLQSADQFLALSDIYPSDIYRNLGISYAYVVFNAFAAVGLYYLFRVRKVSVVGSIKGLIGRLRKGND